MARGQTPAGGRRAANVTAARSVIFHDLAEARAALAADSTIPLQTAPGAAAYAGVGYLMAVIEKAGADKSAAVIDCGEDAGAALAALLSSVTSRTRRAMGCLHAAAETPLWSNFCPIYGVGHL